MVFVRRLTDQQVEQAELMFRQGDTLTAIGRAFNVSRVTIMRELRKKGIDTKPIPIIPHVLDQTTLAYYAGVFDGEGHITIGASKRPNATVNYWLQVGLTSTHKPILESLQEDFGVGHISLFGHSGKGNRLPCWSWRCMSNQALFVLEAFLPFLRIKREPALLAIEFQRENATSKDQAWKLSMKQKITQWNKAS